MSSFVSSGVRSVAGKMTRSGLDTRTSRGPASTNVSFAAGIAGVLPLSRPASFESASRARLQRTGDEAAQRFAVARDPVVARRGRARRQLEGTGDDAAAGQHLEQAGQG